MTLGLILILVVILFLLMCSAFFSGSETALTAASKASMHSLEKSGDRRAGIVNELGRQMDKLISTILIGNNFVNILATALATSFFTSLFGESAGVIYAALIMTPVVVIFSEVMPKTYAIYNPDRTALSVAPFLKFVMQLLTPFAAAIKFIISSIFRIFGFKGNQQNGLISAHEEIRGAIDLHHQEGGVVKGDRDMLGGILDLRELEVSDIMIHRTKMQMIDIDTPSEKLIDDVLKSSYTRIPLWQGQPENIIGVLHAKDFLRALNRVNWDVSKINLMDIANDAWFVPDTTPLKDQLNSFLKRKSHFALVVDEYGEVMGLVTLEDILEEIVGEISDEHDIVVPGVRPQPDGSVNVDGSVPIRDLNRLMDWSLPDAEATTIAGLVIHEAQLIPEPGQAFTFYGYRFEVLRRQRNKITALRIMPQNKSEN